MKQPNKRHTNRKLGKNPNSHLKLSILEHFAMEVSVLRNDGDDDERGIEGEKII